MNSKKGITPVVATVLLMTISVAATGAAYTFIIDAQETAAENAEDELTQQERERQSGLNIEHMYRSSGEVVMNVRNTGSVSQTIEDEDGNRYWSVYVDGLPIEEHGEDWHYVGSPDRPVRISPEETIALETNIEFPSDGEQTQFRLIGRYESEDSYNCYNPNDGDTSNSC